MSILGLGIYILSTLSSNIYFTYVDMRLEVVLYEFLVHKLDLALLLKLDTVQLKLMYKVDKQYMSHSLVALAYTK